MPGHAEVVSVGKFGLREQLLHHLQRPALMRCDSRLPGFATHRNYLHRQRAKIHPHAAIRSSPLERLFRIGGGVVSND